MTNKILALIGESHSLTEKDVGKHKSFKAKGMKFTTAAYNAEGLGHVSVMRASGFFGMMKMDTLVIAPIEKNLPLLSYDRIYVGKKDTAILELYDTMGGEKANLEKVAFVNRRFVNLPTHYGNDEPHWYDNIRLPESMAKKGTKIDSDELDKFTLKYIEAYLATEAEPCDSEHKIARTDAYVDGLLSQGGPATDVFKKKFGIEKTTEILKKVLFGTL